MAEDRRPFRTALKHRDLRLLLGGLAVSNVGDWFYNVALVVYVFDRTHSSAWVAATTIVRLLPYVLFSGAGGALADRLDRRRVMIASDLVRAALMAGLAVSVHQGVHPAFVLAMAFVATVAATPYVPASTALLPTVVTEDALAAANGLVSAVGNAALLAGPALGVLVLSVGSPTIALLVNAGSFLVSALIVTRLRPRPTRRLVREGKGPGVLAGIREIGRSGERVALVGFLCGAAAVYGMEMVLLVLAAERFLGTGPEGFGWLLAAMGLGGLLAAGLSNRLATTARATPFLLAASVGIGLPLALLAVVRDPVLAFTLLIVDGIASLAVDILVITVLQRSIPDDATAGVFGAMDSAMIAALLAGTFLAPPLVTGLGLRGALIAGGALLPVGAVMTLPLLVRAERASRARMAELAPVVDVLRSCDVFAGAVRQSLEILATSVQEVRAAPGDDLVRQGEPADDVFVIVEGEVDVLVDGERVATLGDRDHFGEIGIMDGVPRTATVRATRPTTLYRIDGASFLGVINKSPTVASALQERVRGRLSGLERGPREQDLVSAG